MWVVMGGVGNAQCSMWMRRTQGRSRLDLKAVDGMRVLGLECGRSLAAEYGGEGEQKGRQEVRVGC